MVRSDDLVIISVVLGALLGSGYGPIGIIIGGVVLAIWTDGALDYGKYKRRED